MFDDFLHQLGMVAALLRRAGSSMLESTGSHGRGVERRVPEIRRMFVVSEMTYNVLSGTLNLTIP